MIARSTIHLQFRIAKHADELAFKEIYNIFYKDLFRFGFTFLHNKELTEEAIQDVFTKLWLNRKEIEKIQNLRVYLFKSVKNKCLDYLEKKNILSHFELDELRISIGNTVAAADDKMISAEMLNLFNATLQTLPPKCKLIFQLVKEENLKYKEVAEILDISLKTVENQVAIALKKLYSSLHQHTKK